MSYYTQRYYVIIIIIIISESLYRIKYVQINLKTNYIHINTSVFKYTAINVCPVL